MTADEIRKRTFQPVDRDTLTDDAAWQCAEWLREIAAQLAELNAALLSVTDMCIDPDSKEETARGLHVVTEEYNPV